MKRISITVYENVTSVNDYGEREVELTNIGGTLYAKYTIVHDK